ncbi:dihydrodipicolinate synthase family protein [Fibrella forsythiae]|uniref:Dihydrodipicolinate synthase family protein n=1 Tax=Fibrella forsythiae TaxID=2817061 RepID=A0ABS3JD56_9BACT|nr:dihydrodipicolinate synthase family protein [Fibrella forsythiae]MBO0947925.1 dihydrodipicolinate synthase family protein [Fibrella forsythiae]
MNKRFKGVVVPMVTPLTERYAVDKAAVEKIMVNLQANEAMPFILGTTGESTSLSLAVKKDYVNEAVRLKSADTVLYAGISSNCLEESVEFANFCFDAGVDAVAATLPSYYTLSDDQMKQYFEQLADQLNGPLIIYNILATTRMSIPLAVVEELSYHHRVVGIKDSERNTDRLYDSLALWADRPDFSHFMGWAARSADALLRGSDGLVPSTGNLCPGIYRDLLKAVQDGDEERAYAHQHQSDVFGQLYQAGRTLGDSLAALKVLMQEYDLCGTTMMPPLQSLPMSEDISLRTALAELVEKEAIQL